MTKQELQKTIKKLPRNRIVFVYARPFVNELQESVLYDEFGGPVGYYFPITKKAALFFADNMNDDDLVDVTYYLSDLYLG